MSRLRSCGPAVSAGIGDDRSIVNTKIRRETQWRGELLQNTDVLHIRDAKLATFERLVHKSQSSETGGDVTKIGVTVQGWRTCGSKRTSYPQQRKDRDLDTDARGILEITRTQQCDDSQLMPGALQWRKQGRARPA